MVVKRALSFCRIAREILHNKVDLVGTYALVMNDVGTTSKDQRGKIIYIL